MYLPNNARLQKIALFNSLKKNNLQYILLFQDNKLKTFSHLRPL